jgi:hypothetical protein
MSQPTPFLGTTTDRSKAFPGVKELTVKVAQDPHGMYCEKPWQRESTYSKDNIPRYARCQNPRCQQGGLDLQQIVLLHGNGEHRFYCNGHEGTPKGRRKGYPCGNSFTVAISIEKVAE